MGKPSFEGPVGNTVLGKYGLVINPAQNSWVK